jgi:hypothetical protein
LQNGEKMKKTILLSLIVASMLNANHHIEHGEKEHTQHGEKHHVEHDEKHHNKHEEKAHDEHDEEFAPVISLIGDFSYVKRSKELHEVSIPGFTHVHKEEDGHNHSEAHGKQGFNFNSAELEVEAAIDEHMEVHATFHLSKDSFEVEEFYGTTHNRDGLNYKLGKFLSNFGANNAKHSETWDFAQRPLINTALFGSHGLNETGVSASWNNKNLKVGFEILSGENELSFGRDEIEDRNITIEGSESPDLSVLYAKYNNRFDTVKFDGGLSYAKGKARWKHTNDINSSHALTGDVTLIGLDTAFTLPFSRVSNLKWSTEYIQRKVDNGLRHAAITATTKTVKMDQSGYNTSLVYTINPKYKVGIRYEDILKNDKIVDDVNQNKSEALTITSIMLEHNLSEQNRLRVQYNQDKSKFHDKKLLSYNELIVQWTFAFSTGKHNH